MPGRLPEAGGGSPWKFFPNKAKCRPLAYFTNDEVIGGSPYHLSSPVMFYHHFHDGFGAGDQIQLGASFGNL